MKKYFIGIDLGGTRVKIGLVMDGTVVGRKVISAPSTGGLKEGLPVLRQNIDDLLHEHAVGKERLGGIGLAFAGLADPVAKKILSTNKKYDEAVGLDPEGWVKEHWGVPFFIDNDTRMATVGEWKYGAARDTNDLVVMTIGTGIGTSAIIEGRLLRGRHFQAGCLGGHFSIQYNGRRCNCGNEGCVEAYGSTWCLNEMAKSDAGYPQSLLSRTGSIDLAAVFAAAEKSDALALCIRQTCLDAWSAGIINLIHAYDPEVVVIGGGIMNRSDDILPYLTEKVRRLAWCPWGEVQIRASKLLDDAGILGVVHCLQETI